MKIPIPDDWDGQSWKCIQLNWPDSVLWSVILSGILTGLSRGRFWDERSGSVLDAQEIGKEIERRNFPWVSCSGEQMPEDEVIAVVTGGGCGCVSILEDWIMPCIDLTNLVRIQGGVLQVRDSCCEWHDVVTDGGGITSGGGATGTWEEPGGIDYEYTDVYPCGMANKLASKIHQVSEFIWDYSVAIQSVLMVFAVQTDSHLDLNNLAVIDACNAALIMQGIVLIYAEAFDLEEDDVIPADFDDLVTCALLPYMGTDGTCDGQELLDAFNSWVDSYFAWTSLDDAEKILIRDYWHTIARAIGAGNMRDVAQAGRYDEGDCDCVGVGNVPDEIYGSDGWYLGKERTVLIQGTGGFTHGEGSIVETPPEDVFGCAFSFEFVSGDEIANLKRANACAYSPDFCMTLANSDDFDVDHVYVQAGPLAYAALSSKLDNPEQVNLSGKTSDVVASPLAGILDVVEQRFGVRAVGDEGVAFNTVRVHMRWLHNSGSDSHQ